MTVINKEKVEVEVYTVYGKQFFDKFDAENYKDQVEKVLGYRFYTVRFEFDLTEGRGFFSRKIVGIKENEQDAVASNAIINYCLSEFQEEPPVLSFYGRAQDSWAVSPNSKRFERVEDLQEFFNETKKFPNGANHKFHGIDFCDEFGFKEDDEDTDEKRSFMDTLEPFGEKG